MVVATKRPDGVYDLPVGRGHIGAEVLEIISGALYTNPLHVIREYIQNAVDGGASEVHIDVREQEIVISDNGRGMGLQDLDDARKIAISRKSRDAEIGFRGIGIYSSFSVCDRLEVVTRTASDGAAYRMQFDYKEMRAQIAKAREGIVDPVSALDVLEQHTSIRDAPQDLASVKPEGSFTTVRLTNPAHRFSSRLAEPDLLSNYLVSTVPLDFSDDFVHASAIRTAVAQHVPKLKLIRVVLKLGSQSQKVVVQPVAEGLLPPTMQVLEDPDNGETVAFVWACLNRERRAIKPTQLQGFLVRVKGFAIGDRQYARQLWGRRGYGVLYPWYAGEVYVLDRSITPTAERNDLEESAARERLYRLLGAEFERLERLADRRRGLLVDIQKVDKGQKPQADLPQLLGRLNEIGQEFGTASSITAGQLLDEKTARVGPPTATQAAAPPPQSPPIRPPLPKALPRSNDMSASEGVTTDDETILQLLLALPIEWPREAQQVVGIVDDTLQEDLETPKYHQCVRHARRKLETWEQMDDSDEGQ